MTDSTRIALITGGGRGLGRATALALGRAGVDVIVTWVSQPDAADAVVAELRGTGRQAAALQLDVADPDAFAPFAATLAELLQREWGRDSFDLLMNNAGIGTATPAGQLTRAAIESLLAVHVTGPMLLTQELEPMLADGGRILFVSTGLTRMNANPLYSAYASAKGAIEVFTRYLAAQLGPRGIAVNAIAPGATATDFGGGYLRENAAFREQIAGIVAMRRVGEPDDIGEAAAAILAGGMGWVTAQRIEASGGQAL